MLKARPVITASFLFFTLNANAQVICGSAASDADGDGWGWENAGTCIVSSDLQATPDSQQTALTALEQGTPIAALPFSNADISDGYAIVSPLDDSATGSIYSRTGDTRWTEQASVSVPDFEVPNALEESRGVFAISDNYAVVGVPEYYTSNAGSAHIFARINDSSDQWVLETILDGPSRPWDFFGKSVAISGDTLAVGSNPGGEAFQSGRVSIYSRGDDGWMLDQSIDSSFVDSDEFGNSVLLSNDLLVIPHTRDDGNADIYQRSTNDWQLHSEISGDIFALNQNTIVTADTSVLRTYLLDESNVFQLVNSIEYPDNSITSIALSEQRLVVAFSNDTNVHHFVKSADNNWQYAGAIDATPSIPVNADRLFITINGISDQSVIISRAAFPENVEPFFDAYIVDLPEIETVSTVPNSSDLETGTDSIEQADESPGTGEQSVTTECIDTDGDGYGWNGTETCFPNGIIPTHDTGIDTTSGDQPLACIDNDGDGYGWDGFQTCTQSIPEDVFTSEESTAPVCFDLDGDGYGWTGTQSCSFNADGSITLL